MSAATSEPASRDSSSIIFAYGEFSFSITYSQTIKRPKAWTKKTLPLGKMRRKGRSMLIYSMPTLSDISSGAVPFVSIGEVEVLETKNTKVICQS